MFNGAIEGNEILQDSAVGISLMIGFETPYAICVGISLMIGSATPYATCVGIMVIGSATPYATCVVLELFLTPKGDMTFHYC